MTTQNHLPDIEAAWKEHKRKKIKQAPQNTLRASTLGFPCDRHHYHSLKDWDKKQLHDEVLQSIFDEGSLHEKAVIKELMDIGFEIIEFQRALQHDKPLITGHIDGIIRWNGRDLPFDVKSISYGFDDIQSAEDLLYSKKLWQRSYPAQLQLYLYMAARDEVGCFILKDKMTGRIKPVWMQIDYDYLESLLKRAERVYAAVEKGEPPAKINNYEICDECDFKNICLPDIRLDEGMILLEDKALKDCLDKWWELKDAAKEWNAVDKKIKDACKASGQTGEMIVGDYLIKVSSYTTEKKIPLTWEIEKSIVFKTQILKQERSQNGET